MPIPRQPLEDLYLNQKLTQQKIAEVLGVTRKRVKFYLDKYGIPRRSKREIYELLSGPNNYRWKGGRHPTRWGYIIVKCPGHHKTNHQGYVREHVLIWEKVNGRELPLGWVIHHINGIKDDNRPENLMAMPKRGHLSDLLLRSAQARIKELEEELKLCQSHLN